MTGWQCPDCGRAAVCSRQEWVAVYDYRRQIRDATPRVLAQKLAGYGIDSRAADWAEDMVVRWAEREVGGPEYICANCVTPFSGQEVPA